MIEIHELAAALDPGPRSVISLVGGGGKTTALFALGRQLPGSVVLTTTTKMGVDRVEDHTPVLAPTDATLMSEVDRGGTVLVWSGIDDHRALGVDAATCDRWAMLVDHLVIEADGARRRPFKCPAPHEPIVPASTSLLVGCVGSAAFGAVITASCHRPEWVARVAGCAPTDTLTPGRLAAVLRSAEGTQKGRPSGARFAVLLHRVDATDEPYLVALDAALEGEVDLIGVAAFE